jgi:hypothetical protein
VLQVLCRSDGVEAAFGEPASVRDMAEELYISPAAVKQHLLNMYDKFDIFDAPGESRRVRLANEVVRRGVLRDQPLPEPDPLDAGRRAFEMRDWDAAFDLLTAADSQTPLAPVDLERLGDAGMWSLRHDAAVSAHSRAHFAYIGSGDSCGAMRTAIALTGSHLSRMRFSVAAGWLARGRRAGEGRAECPEFAIVLALASLSQAFGGDLDTALASAKSANEMGSRVGDHNSCALSLVVEGWVRLQRGELSAGVALLDEAMSSAAAGQLSPMVTAIVYCRTLSACLNVFDFPRALEWAEEVHLLESTTPSVGFPGDCAIHRAALDLVGGRWSAAEAGAQRACHGRGPFELSHAIDAHATIADVRLRMGDLVGASRAIDRVVELGGTGEPGRSLLRLARGDCAGAAKSIHTALAGAADPLGRARLLPVHIDIAVACGDLAAASDAAVELESTAAQVGTAGLQAVSLQARGTVDLARAENSAALRPLRGAILRWREAGAPYEAARCGYLLGAALRRIGDDAAADAQIGAAAAALEGLGVSPEAIRRMPVS